MARFGAQPEGTGPIFRTALLHLPNTLAPLAGQALAYVQQVHGAQCAAPCRKLGAVADLKLVLTGPS